MSAAYPLPGAPLPLPAASASVARAGNWKSLCSVPCVPCRFSLVQFKLAYGVSVAAPLKFIFKQNNAAPTSAAAAATQTTKTTKLAAAARRTSRSSRGRRRANQSSNSSNPQCFPSPLCVGSSHKAKDIDTRSRYIFKIASHCLPPVSVSASVCACTCACVCSRLVSLLQPIDFSPKYLAANAGGSPTIAGYCPLQPASVYSPPRPQAARRPNLKTAVAYSRRQRSADNNV